MLLHDVELLFDDLVGSVELGATAMIAVLRPQRVLLGLEMSRERLASSRGGLRLRRLFLQWLRRWLWSRDERGLCSLIDDRRHCGLQLHRLALPALRGGQQLCNPIVQLRQLFCQLRDELPKSSVLSLQVCVRRHIQ